MNKLEVIYVSRVSEACIINVEKIDKRAGDQSPKKRAQGLAQRPPFRLRCQAHRKPRRHYQYAQMALLNPWSKGQSLVRRQLHVEHGLFP